MGRSAKVARLGNFATHKKNVRSRVLVEKKRPKKTEKATTEQRRGAPSDAAKSKRTPHSSKD